MRQSLLVDIDVENGIQDIQVALSWLFSIFFFKGFLVNYLVSGDIPWDVLRIRCEFHDSMIHDAPIIIFQLPLRVRSSEFGHQNTSMGDFSEGSSRELSKFSHQ